MAATSRNSRLPIAEFTEASLVAAHCRASSWGNTLRRRKVSLPSSGARTTPLQKAVMRIVLIRGSRAMRATDNPNPLSAYNSATVSDWNLAIALRTAARTGLSNCS
ncbi:hypothetical protein SUDANB91_07025 [Streptomyces sp. SudanB91_2054]